MRQECSVCSFLPGAVVLESTNSRLGHFGVVFTVDVLAEGNGQNHPQQLQGRRGKESATRQIKWKGRVVERRTPQWSPLK